MNDQNESNQRKVDDNIGGVLSNASPRPTPRAARKEEIYGELLGELQAGLSAKKRKRRFMISSVAASIVAAVVLISQVGSGPGDIPAALEATLARSAGNGTTLNGQPMRDQTLRNSSVRFRVDDRLSTGPNAAISIAWNTMGSLRLSSSSSLIFSSNSGVELVEGSLYYDSKSHDRENTSDIIVDTLYGRIHHVGTQFVATVGSAGVNVSVREGEVTFGEGVDSITIEAGQSASINADLEATFSSIGSTDDRWTWVSNIAPPLDIDGLSTREIIDWLSKETGQIVVYDNAAAEDFAMRDSIRGIGEIEPVSAIGVIALATGLEFTVDNEILRVGLKRQ